jgi:hypothetical protein
MQRSLESPTCYRWQLTSAKTSLENNQGMAAPSTMIFFSEEEFVTEAAKTLLESYFTEAEIKRGCISIL